MGTMDRILRLMAERKASDVYLSAHAPAQIRINGACVPINSQILPPDAPLELLREVVDPLRLGELERTGELNMAVAIEGVGNFRISAMRHSNCARPAYRVFNSVHTGSTQWHQDESTSK